MPWPRGWRTRLANPLAAVPATVDFATREVSEHLKAVLCCMFPELLDELLPAREAARRVRQIVRDSLRIFSRPEIDATGPVDPTRGPREQRRCEMA